MARRGPLVLPAPASRSWLVLDRQHASRASLRRNQTEEAILNYFKTFSLLITPASYLPARPQDRPYPSPSSPTLVPAMAAQPILSAVVIGGEVRLNVYYYGLDLSTHNVLLHILSRASSVTTSCRRSRPDSPKRPSPPSMSPNASHLQATPSSLSISTTKTPCWPRSKGQAQTRSSTRLLRGWAPARRSRKRSTCKAPRLSSQLAKKPASKNWSTRPAAACALTKRP